MTEGDHNRSEGLRGAVAEKARLLAESIKCSEEYGRFMRALKELEQHEAARLMLRDLRSREARALVAQLRGEKLSEEARRELDRLYELVGFNPYAREVLEAELEFGRMMAAVQRALSEALDELRELEKRLEISPAAIEEALERAGGPGPDEKAEERASRAGEETGRSVERPTPTRSRLWVPGSGMR